MNKRLLVTVFAILVLGPALTASTGQAQVPVLTPGTYARTDLPQTWTAPQSFGTQASLDGAAITSGTLRQAVIPGLDASKIATGTIGPARLPPGANGHVAITTTSGGSYALQPADQVIFLRNGGSVQLPAAASDIGREITIKAGFTTPASVVPAPGENIDGPNAATSNNPLGLRVAEAVTLVSTGTEWISTSWVRCNC